ncbi:MAG: signal peptidase II [Lachnospiraceae bacterium]|nr:signal peptidase II [Lachnospiraceae bacterium]
MKIASIGCLAFLSDYITKRLAEARLPLNGDLKVLPGGKMALQRINNEGTAGGYFGGRRLVKVMAAGMAFLSFVQSLIYKWRKDNIFLRLGSTLVLAGGLGNLNDRLTRGHVTDFLRFKVGKNFTRLVYNVADLFIFLGAFFVALGELVKKIHELRRTDMKRDD